MSLLMLSYVFSKSRTQSMDLKILLLSHGCALDLEVFLDVLWEEL